MAFTFDDKTVPKHVNMKRVNADFLQNYVFHGQYDVDTKLTRDAIDLPVQIIVSNDYNDLNMAGFNYLTGPVLGMASGKVERGVQARGVVTIDVLATHPDMRDHVMAEICVAYFSDQGLCWFYGHPDVEVHGYNMISMNETEFNPSLGGKVSYLYLASLGIRFEYDIYTVQSYDTISKVKTYQILVP